MLILTRKAGQTIKIGDDITVTVTHTRSGIAKIGIDAPRELQITRGEHCPHIFAPAEAACDARAIGNGDILTCPTCGHTDTLDGFDAIGACGDANVFCQVCHTEFDSNTGAEHVCDPGNPACRIAADYLKTPQGIRELADKACDARLQKQLNRLGCEWADPGPTGLQFAALVDAVVELEKRTAEVSPMPDRNESRRKVESAIARATPEGAEMSGDKCVDCGRPIIFSARAIGDGRCHVCGHKTAADLRRKLDAATKRNPAG